MRGLKDFRAIGVAIGEGIAEGMQGVKAAPGVETYAGALADAEAEVADLQAERSDLETERSDLQDQLRQISDIGKRVVVERDEARDLLAKAHAMVEGQATALEEAGVALTAAQEQIALQDEEIAQLKADLAQRSARALGSVIEKVAVSKERDPSVADFAFGERRATSPFVPNGEEKVVPAASPPDAPKKLSRLAELHGERIRALDADMVPVTMMADEINNHAKRNAWVNTGLVKSILRELGL